MRLLSVVTDERRVSICPRCGAPVQYAKFIARGHNVRGVYWSPVPHECVPVARLEPLAVEPPAGERDA